MNRVSTRLITLGLLLTLDFGVGNRNLVAQTTAGTITGTVTDQTGAVVPAAAVKVRHLDSGAVRSATTEADGRFTFPALPIGPYEFTAEAKGFARHVRGGIVLLLNQVAVVNPILQPAGVSEVITVSENAPLLDTQTAEVGVRFDERRITDLPSSGQFNLGGGFRDVFGYALSAAGVSQLNSGNSPRAGGTNFSVNGNRPRGNNFIIDGQDSNDPSVTGRQQWMNNPDMIQEYRLVTSQFLAEHGRNSGSVVSVITKSGTNNYHGSGFWFYNSNALNSLSNLEKAAGYTSAPFINEHQLGGTLGGPIRKDKTFFFGSYQRWTQRQTGTGNTISGVPTEEGRRVLQQLAGSRPQVAALLKYLPAAQNTRGTPIPISVGGQNGIVPVGDLTSSANAGQNNDQMSIRLDQNLGAHRLGGRYLYSNTYQYGSGQVTPPGNTTVVPSRQQAGTVFFTSSLSAHMLNDFRVSYQRHASVTTASDPSSEAIPSIEITQLGLNEFNASTSRTGIGLAANLPQWRRNNNYQLQETFSLIRGAHAWKFGADLRRLDLATFFMPLTRGRLAYGTLQQFINDEPTAASLNKPLPGGETVQHYKFYDRFFFAQDTWAVTRRLTLNLGLRWELPGNAMASLYPVNDRILAANRNEVFRLTQLPRFSETAIGK